MIYVFRRIDGFYGADYSREYCERNGNIVAEYRTDDRSALEALIRNPDNNAPQRVLALAARALRELNESVPPAIEALPPRAVRERGFFGRLKYAFFKR